MSRREDRMSTNRTSPRDAFGGPKRPRGPDGRPTCRVCHSSVPSPRRTFCRQECVDQFLILTSPTSARGLVFNRDKGVCRRCGLDTERLRKALDDIRFPGGWTEEETGFPHKEIFEIWKKLTGVLGLRFGRVTLWDADHIRPVKDGGGECGLENYQTLCLWCHKAKTARQAAKIENNIP